MNLNARLTKLELTHPPKDTREPLLVKFIGYDDDGTNPDIAGILYTYDGNEPKHLNKQELEAIDQ